ncbi:unnamed protein product [Oncorhynchus mykiss]|uniref:Uncharacterized protein n=1 Tax=Oncorhynchus mykiss TaxID=8022 RepID=A0A060YJ76_ONCMY|nr:unnamed protein product [Oncorhynchus mykiss]
MSRLFSTPSKLSEDDVDLEALVNDMNSSFESLYSTCSSVQSESVPLLQHNGQVHVHRNHHRSAPMPPHTHTSASELQHSPTSPKQRLQRSQPMHILAVRRLQEEEQQLRTSSLPAIPNPFPELSGSPVLSPGSLPPCQPSGTYVSQRPFSSLLTMIS